MKIHPREPICREAEQKLIAAVAEATKDLTDLEALRVVQNVLGDHVSSFVKYAIREERHGDERKPGGLA